MAKRSDIRKFAYSCIDQIFDLYETSDTELHEKSSANQLENARAAVDLWWQLFDVLLVRAQAQITGQAILANMPEIRDSVTRYLGRTPTGNDPMLETLGLLFVAYPHDPDDPELMLMERWLESYQSSEGTEGLLDQSAVKEVLSPSVLREIIVSLLSSRSANSAFWRHELQEALEALELGDTLELLTPQTKGGHGSPHELQRWKGHAIRQVWFRVGAGKLKREALEEVGDGIAQSTEALKTWEKNLRRSEEGRNNLDCSRLAGKIGREFRRRSYDQFEYPESFGEFRGQLNLQTAEYLYWLVTDTSLETIKSNLRKFRLEKSTVTRRDR